MNAHPHTLFLRDLSHLLIEMGSEARAERDRSSGVERAAADARLLAFHEVISLMQQQADAFGISRTEIGLADVDPERDLL